MTGKGRDNLTVAAVSIGIMARALLYLSIPTPSVPVAASSETPETRELPPDFDQEEHRAELTELLNRGRGVGTVVRTPEASRFRQLAWVHELGEGWVLDAEAFRETLHITVSAQFNRGWPIATCAAQR